MKFNDNLKLVPICVAYRWCQTYTIKFPKKVRDYSKKVRKLPRKIRENPRTIREYPKKVRKLPRKIRAHPKRYEFASVCVV